MHIFCSGIGGIGLSAYASLRRSAGHTVSGTDRTKSALTDELEKQGIGFSTDQSATQIPAACDLLVYSEAIPADAPQRLEAAKRGIEQQSYPQALGELSKNHRVIAVCGTHGKSSTTGMAARLLLECGFDPTIVVGTKLHELDGRNWRAGKSDIFLLEACEYRRSFAAYTPHDILLTNCDGDHFDYYESPEDYRSAFIDFAKKLPEDGTLITHQTDQNCQAVCVAANRSTLNADTFPFVTLHTPGLHMRQNAQLVLGLASVLGIEPTKAQAAVAGYAGSWRRMERKGTMGNAAIVIDDYAHHPVEIRATLAALKSAYPDRRLVCIFQPHTHDRTIKLYEDFLDAFREADLLIVSSVYEARSDIETQKVKMKKFVSDIQKASNVRTIDGGSLEDIRKNLPSLSQSSDLVVCMGAGDITALAATLTQQ